MSKEQSRKLGPKAPEAPESSGLSAPLTDCKDVVLGIGDRAFGEGNKLGEASADYVCEQTYAGFTAGLARGLKARSNPFKDFALAPNESVFTFPSVGGEGTEVPRLGSKSSVKTLPKS